MTESTDLPQRSAFPVSLPFTLRWAEIDMFGHLNNAAYYGLFDTAINSWIASETGIDAASTPFMNVVAESACKFLSPVTFNDKLEVALGVRSIGTASITYTLGLYLQLDGLPTLAAYGHWVHVYTDRDTKRATPIPDAIRTLAQSASMPAAPAFTLKSGSKVTNVQRTTQS